MSTTSSDKHEIAPQAEVTLSQEALRSSIPVRPDNVELVSALMSYMGLDVRNHGTIQVAVPNTDQAQEAVRLGWKPLEHRTAEEVGSSIVKVFGEFQAVINSNPASVKDAYIQAYDFNERLRAERLANSDPVRRTQLMVFAETDVVPYPGMSLTERQNPDGTISFAISLVRNLWDADQPQAS
ncbi:MAG: hypothetical protein KIH63_003005 [Candidatus Saccharibacteria bacterium]|nr:hypothetical protein [Candidatus Saccharibacteria bacterium]